MELVSFEISGIREVRFLIEASDMGQSNGACLVELLPQIYCDPFLFGSTTIYAFVSISLKIYDGQHIGNCTHSSQTVALSYLNCIIYYGAPERPLHQKIFDN